MKRKRIISSDHKLNVESERTWKSGKLQTTRHGSNFSSNDKGYSFVCYRRRRFSFSGYGTALSHVVLVLTELSNDLTNVLSYYISVKRSLWKLTSHRIEEVYNVLSLTIQQNFSKLEQHLIQNSKVFNFCHSFSLNF